jgi:DNA polymerase-3 subunit chi
MTRIDFYILADDTAEKRLTFACRLIDKAQKLGNQVYVACESEAQAKSLSEQLWSFQPESFTAHDVEAQPQRQSKVHLGWDDDATHHHGVMVNLRGNVPATFSRFERLTEIVSQEPEVLEKTRQNYSFYRERGYPINNHDLRQ